MICGVSIPKAIVQKIVKEAKSTENEIIGLLIGQYDDGIIVIKDAVSGEQQSDKTHVKLFTKTIAEITHKIMNGEISGLIVGWYHSHPGYGIFFSDTDISTQLKFHQFSENVCGIVIDPTTNEMGVFTINRLGNLIQLNEKAINIFGEKEEAIPEKLRQLVTPSLQMVEIVHPMEFEPLPEIIDWIPPIGRDRNIAEQKLLRYKKKLNTAYKMEIMTKQECRMKVAFKRIELGLDPPRIHFEDVI